MESDEHFYFYVGELRHRAGGGPFVVGGFDFHSGLCAAAPNPWGRPLYVLDTRGHREAPGEASLVHYARSGYQLEWQGKEFEEYPCLLTTDPTYKKMFFLRVRVETGAYQAHEKWPPLWMLTVRGEKWVGVLSDPCGREATLTLFTSEDRLPEPLLSYNPDWSDSIDEWVEGNFRFEVIR